MPLKWVNDTMGSISLLSTLLEFDFFPTLSITQSDFPSRTYVWLIVGRFEKKWLKLFLGSTFLVCFPLACVRLPATPSSRTVHIYMESSILVEAPYLVPRAGEKQA